MKKVLIHIPKNAGTSIRQQFSPYKPVWEKHACIQEIFDTLGEQQFSKSSYLSVIRNPYSRVYSWYKFHKAHKVLAPYYHGTFSEWVLRGCPHHYSSSPYFGLRTGQKYDAYNFAPTKQSAFLQLQGKYIKRNKKLIWSPDRKEKVIPDFVKILKMEELAERWGELQVFFNRPASNIRVNKSANPKEYKRFYNNKTRTIVEGLCYEDLSLFDYKFE